MRIAVFLLSLLLAVPASAQQYPAKPVKVIVPFAPGGGSDIVARAVTTKLAETLGQPFVIENRGGAGGLVGMEAAAKTPADGYTILIMSDSFPVIAATHRPAFDPINSLVPVAQLSVAPFGLILHPSVPANSVAEFVALAKSKPGAFSYGSSGNGGLTHLVSEMFSDMAGVKMVHVPYKSTGAAMPDFLSGTIQVYVGNVSPLLQHIQSGKLKLLGVTNAKRWPLLPDVPTIGETVKGFAADPWFGLFVPRGTPQPIVDRLQAEAAAMFADPETNRRLAGEGAEPVASKPAEFAAFVRAEIKKWDEVGKAANIVPTE